MEVNPVDFTLPLSPNLETNDLEETDTNPGDDASTVEGLVNPVRGLLRKVSHPLRAARSKLKGWMTKKMEHSDHPYVQLKWDVFSKLRIDHLHGNP